MNKDLIYGKDPTERIVSIEPGEGEATVFRQLEDGTIVEDKVPHTYWMLFTEKESPKMQELSGDQSYKYLLEYDGRERYDEVLKQVRDGRIDHWVCRDYQEMHLTRTGRTYFKGMKLKEVSVLSFDLEDTFGIARRKDGKILIISNTFRDHTGRITKKMFTHDQYSSQAAMLMYWCEWVRMMDPSIVIGHNVFGYDFDILMLAAEKNGVQLSLGRDGSSLRFESRYDKRSDSIKPKTSKFRKDGSQSYDYVNYRIYGREIVDTFFLSIKYDIARNYPNYKLKDIMAHEGWEKKDRQHYDASLIHKNYLIPDEWEKIKAYASDDSDDPLVLFDNMASAYFYYTQSIPRSFQHVINSATGSQVNGLMVRGYLQQGHSIAYPSQKESYAGAISFGIPGLHKNVLRLDVASLYPSIMRQYKIYDPVKDPQALFLNLVESLTLQRLENKRLAKETGDRHYKDLEQAQKIMINSMYGFLGADKLNYNIPSGADDVTGNGRAILKFAVRWATGKDIPPEVFGEAGEIKNDKTYDLDTLPMGTTHSFVLVAGDTDGLAIKKRNESAFTEDEQKALVQDLNSRMPELIRWENDGVVKRQLCIKTKNYCLIDSKGKKKIKGSALKASMKEPALQNFIERVIDLFLTDKKDQIFLEYLKVASEIKSMTDIARWCSKKTVTEAVLKSKRTQELKIRNAFNGRQFQAGDKIFVFFENKEKLTLREDFSGEYCQKTLYGKLHDTLCIFAPVLDAGLFPDFGNKKHKELI